MLLLNQQNCHVMYCKLYVHLLIQPASDLDCSYKYWSILSFVEINLVERTMYCTQDLNIPTGTYKRTVYVITALLIIILVFLNSTELAKLVLS